MQPIFPAQAIGAVKRLGGWPKIIDAIIGPIAILVIDLLRDGTVNIQSCQSMGHIGSPVYCKSDIPLRS